MLTWRGLRPTLARAGYLAVALSDVCSVVQVTRSDLTTSDETRKAMTVPRPARDGHHLVRRSRGRSAQDQAAGGPRHLQHDRGLHPRRGELARWIWRGLSPPADVAVWANVWAKRPVVAKKLNDFSGGAGSRTLEGGIWQVGDVARLSSLGFEDRRLFRRMRSPLESTGFPLDRPGSWRRIWRRIWRHGEYGPSGPGPKGAVTYRTGPIGVDESVRPGRKRRPGWPPKCRQLGARWAP